MPSSIKAIYRTFINEDFLLQNDFAKILYHNYAKSLPIIDYHNHLPPNEIAQNRRFANISQAWLAGDHYKWRAMRTLGIDEKYITGVGSDREKFQKWAETVPFTLRNPLYHWTHLELQRYFGITDLLDSSSADMIYDMCSEKLQDSNFASVGLLEHMQVETICTTDDPTDDLQHHLDFANQKQKLAMYPAFRPDKAFAIENPKIYSEYIKKLAAVSSQVISTYEDLLEALLTRIDYFHDAGCRLSDHGLEQLYHFKKFNKSENEIFQAALNGKVATKEETAFFKYKTLLALSKMYHAKGWTQQFHLGALRNNSSRMLQSIGPDSGFDSVGDFPQALALSAFLNELDKDDKLCKTVLYNLNPSDNEVFATMTGNFNDGSVKGKIQFGSGWWFLDQKDGMERQLNTVSNMGMLSCFVGMLTDSRSFLSFPRHEYFRRILCNLLGKDVTNGELPNDEKWIGKVVQDICYYNAKDYFNFPKL